MPILSRRLARRALPALLLLALASASAPSGAVADAPNVVSGNGISVAGWRWITPRTLEVDISSAKVAAVAVNGPHRVRITLPNDYFATGSTRYPVLYLLHGGAGGNSAQWTTGGGAVEPITNNRPLITVTPDGGKVGWYTNWVDQAQGAQAWADFHLNQLIPWVDRTFPTVADRTGRAIAGLSMGGFGAMSYTARHPDLFAAAGSFSGALNPTYGHGYGQAFVTLASAYFNDGRVTQCIWGDAATQEVRWQGHDPTYLAGNIEATSLYVASGGGDAESPAMARPARSATVGYVRSIHGISSPTW